MARPFCDQCRSMVPASTNRCGKCGHVHKNWDVKGKGSLSPRPRPKEMAPEKERELSDGRNGLFPYVPRPHQREIVSVIKDALTVERHIVVESGTGTGKTVCSLVAALEMAKERDGKIVYLTRTISQSEQVIEELRSISRIRRVTGLPLLGRGKSCQFLRDIGELTGVAPHAMSRICEEGKKRAVAKRNGACPYYANLLGFKDDTFLNYLHNDIPTAEEFDRYCEGMGVCAYECRKKLMPDVDVVIAPYVHMLNEDIRNPLLEKIGRSASELTMIIDEAHNLWDAARENEGLSFSLMEMDNGMSEIKEHGDESVGHGLILREVTDVLGSIITEVVRSQIPAGESQARLGRKFLEGEMARSLDITTDEVRGVASNIFNLGDVIVQDLADDSKPPVSVTLKVGRFLVDWFSAEESRFMKIISRDGGGSLVAECLEPLEIKQFFSSCRKVLHMSGTLEPLEQYVETMGLPGDTVRRSFPSPFPPENKLVLYTPDINPGHKEMNADPGMLGRIEDRIVSICNASRCNTMVFYRSYDLMRRMRPGLEGRLGRHLYWDEGRSMKVFDQSIQEFKRRRDGIFFTAMGGRVSEGLDFPGDELRMIMIVGLPFPPPTLVSKELSDRTDRRYGRGKGWKYTSEVPAIRKVQQAVGRLIRTETDRGVAIIIDSRVERYAGVLNAKASDDPASDVREFFARSKK